MTTKNSWIKRKSRYGESGFRDVEKVKEKHSNTLKLLYKNGLYKGNKGKHWVNTNESNKKRSIALSGRKLSEEHIENLRKSHLGKKLTEQDKKNKRLAAIRYMEKCKMEGKPFIPRIGNNEDKILDILETLYCYKIQRQYKIESLGYFVDGYIKELNLCIEVDEPHHNRITISKHDIERQNRIENELNCSFLRIGTDG